MYWVRVRVLQPRVSISFVHPLSFFVCSLYVIFILVQIGHVFYCLTKYYTISLNVLFWHTNCYHKWYYPLFKF